MSKGVLIGICTYSLWGFFPIYWKALGSVPSMQVLAHRVVWSIVWLALWLTLVRGWAAVRDVLRNRSVLLPLIVASLLLSLNWYVYIWAVNAGFVLETSLGYFINPLISVLLGVIFLGERLRSWQIVAALLATGGVLYLTFGYGQPPWISLVLAGSFGLYGFIKKKINLAAAEGLFVETAIVFGLALGYLMFVEANGTGAFGHVSWGIETLLVLAGVATALPLVLFAAAARLVQLSTMGFLQYIAPTIQFALGLFLYHEPFSYERLIGFCLIWAALLIFTVDGFRQRIVLVKKQRSKEAGQPFDSAQDKHFS